MIDLQLNIFSQGFSRKSEEYSMNRYPFIGYIWFGSFIIILLGILMDSEKIIKLGQKIGLLNMGITLTLLFYIVIQRQRTSLRTRTGAQTL